jgi:hypothetical protein
VTRTDSKQTTRADVWTARLLVVCNEKLGEETPDKVLAIANHPNFPAWQRR